MIIDHIIKKPSLWNHAMLVTKWKWPYFCNRSMITWIAWNTKTSLSNLRPQLTVFHQDPCPIFRVWWFSPYRPLHGFIGRALRPLPSLPPSFPSPWFLSFFVRRAEETPGARLWHQARPAAFGWTHTRFFTIACDVCRWRDKFARCTILRHASWLWYGVIRMECFIWLSPRQSGRWSLVVGVPQRFKICRLRLLRFASCSAGRGVWSFRKLDPGRKRRMGRNVSWVFCWPQQRPWKSAVRPYKPFHRFRLRTWRSRQSENRNCCESRVLGCASLAPGGRGASALLQNLLVRRSRTAHCSLFVCSIESTSAYGSLWAERAEYEERVRRCDASAAKPLSRLHGMCNIRIAKHLICTSDSNLKRVEIASCSCDATAASFHSILSISYRSWRVGLSLWLFAQWCVLFFSSPPSSIHPGLLANSRKATASWVREPWRRRAIVGILAPSCRVGERNGRWMSRLRSRLPLAFHSTVADRVQRMWAMCKCVEVP